MSAATRGSGARISSVLTGASTCRSRAASSTARTLAVLAAFVWTAPPALADAAAGKATGLAGGRRGRAAKRAMYARRRRAGAVRHRGLGVCCRRARRRIRGRRIFYARNCAGRSRAPLDRWRARGWGETRPHVDLNRAGLLMLSAAARGRRRRGRPGRREPEPRGLADRLSARAQSDPRAPSRRWPLSGAEPAARAGRNAGAALASLRRRSVDRGASSR